MIATVLVLTIYFGRAFNARNMPTLALEHHIEFEHEFDASMEKQTGWDAYLAIEPRLAAELREKIPTASRAGSPADRYFVNSLTHPEKFNSNWNRSYETSVPSPKGVAVLLHGLTDSPYSMLATAQTLAGAGYNVVAPRMPGHGFAVSGLVQARWENWTAAVRIAVRRAVERPGADQSLLIVGYSNGGLLAVDYALRCAESDDMTCPDALVLMSPGIAISKAAAVTNWHKAISWLPYFEKFKWFTVLPEVDPFKFTSFPKQAAWEVHKISNRVHKRLADATSAALLPPILTFQSIVDNTVGATAIIDTLYKRLPTNGSDIVVYDINRNSTVAHLLKNPPQDPTEYFTAMAPMTFDVTILKNRERSENAIERQVLTAGQSDVTSQSTTMQWPSEFYSLSHIAVPFRPDDVIYGNGRGGAAAGPQIFLGALAPRGESGVLLLTPDFFLRARYNPFFAFQSQHLLDWLSIR